MLKAYNIQARNHIEYFSNGCINRRFLVFADDIVTAVMKAEEAVQGLRNSLISAGLPQVAEDLAINSVEETAEVIGEIGEVRDGWSGNSSADIWIERVKKAVKRNTNE